MRSLSTKMLAVAVVALLVSPVLAQQRQGGGRQGGRGGFGGFGGFAPQGSMLLLNKGVQDELKLTDEQKAQLTKIQDKQREAFQKLRDTRGDREKAQKIMQEAREEATKAADKVKDGLKPEQVKRLKQIQVQVGMQTSPLATLNIADVQKDLGLNDKQKQELKVLAEDTRKDTQELMQGLREARGDRERSQQIFQKVQALNKEATGKAKAVLTDTQKKTLTELEGAKFDYKPEFGGFGGGRQGGRRQGGGNRQPPQ
jgi:Spy/CpxP family protein refolding chaperone